MPVLQAGPYPLPNVRMPTWLVRFDKDGVCTSPGTAKALIDQIQKSDYSNVLFYAHGWNTDFTAAVDQYSRFLRSFEAVIDQHPLPNFKPIFVGVTWPSVWMPSTPGPQMAAIGDGEEVALTATLREAVIADIAEGLNADQRGELYDLVDTEILSREKALRLAELVSPIIARTPEEADGGEGQPIDAAGILRLATSMRSGNPPVEAGIDLDNVGVVGGGVGGVAAAGDGWDPTDIIKLASLFQMKDRAGRVGAGGVAVLLRSLLAATAAKDTGVHVFGHSFGAKVMLSALCAAQPLPRKPESLMLLQPAISHLCFADVVPGRPGPGGFRAALDLTASPIFTTFSRMDFPLHNVFHLALRRPADLGELKAAAAAAAGEPPDRYAALGGYGPRHSGQHAALDPIPALGQAYPDLAGAKVVGLDGSDHRITSHGDVANSFTAWALRTQIERS